MAKAKTKSPRRVLGLDPGTVNFGWALYTEGRPTDIGWLHPIAGVNDDADFLNYSIELLLRLRPTDVIIERYMFRGTQSVQAELVNQMIGRFTVLVKMHLGIECTQITSASWKNHFKVKTLENGSWDIFPDLWDFFDEIHQVDAAAIAKYGDEWWLVEDDEAA